MKTTLRWSALLVAIITTAIGGLFLSNALGRQRRVSPAAPATAGAQRTATHILAPTASIFSAPIELTGHPQPSPQIFYQGDGEPEIKTDIWGNVYVTAIQGVPGGVDLWKSINKGTSFVYLGQPDGAQDHCQTLLQCAAAGGGDDSIDVSNGGYLYVSSLWGESVTMSVSTDGGTGGTLPGQAWNVNPAAATIPGIVPLVIGDDRQWIAAYGPQTVYLAYKDALSGIDVEKSTDGGKTFGPPTMPYDVTSTLFADLQGNMVVDQYNGNIYTTFIPNESSGHTHAEIWLARSTDGGATWSLFKAYQGPTGTSNAGVFPILAVDLGGNLHLVFTQIDALRHCHVFLTSTSNPGAASPTWLPAIQVDSGSGNTVTAVQPWVVAGSPGIVDLTWLGSAAANPDVASDWFVHFAQTTNALSGSPIFNQVQVTANRMHNHSICFNGGGCASNGTPHGEPGNRDMLEYYTMTLDPEGNANIAYSDSVTNCNDSDACLTNAWFVKQTGGTSAYAPPAGPAPASFAATINMPGSNGAAEPSVWADSHNCIYGSAPGNPYFWASEDGGYTFRNTTVPPVLGGGDEDVTTIRQQSGARNDALYYADLALADVGIFKSTDRGVTWSSSATPYGQLSASSDRQWISGDRINGGVDQILWEMDHELASEDIRVSASINDSAWGSSTATVDPELSGTIPNTNPGPVFVNKMTHEAIGVFLASTQTTNLADPPFGKEPHIWDFVASPPAAGGAPPVNVANHPIFKGVIDSPTTAPAGTTTYGSHLAAIFPGADADSDGNVYAVWTTLSARPNATIGANPATTWDIWFASSHDGGKTFYGPFKVSSGVGTSVFPWIAAGDAGKVDIVWYQSDNPTPPLLSDPTTPGELTGGPNAMPAGSVWNVMFAQSLNANSREPSFTVVQAGDNPNHRGNISIGGLTGSSDRSLLDYFEVAVGPDGLANILYADNANATGAEGLHVSYVRQNGGPVVKNNPSGLTCLAGAPIPIKVVSQKTHGTVGTFDVNLPLSPHGLECRTGQPGTDQHKVVFTFPVPVTLTSASVTSGNGSVNSTTVSGNTVTVNLTASPGPQKIVIKLTGVNDGAGNSGDISWPMDILRGDTNADHFVDSADIAQTKSQSGKAVTGANFREDLNIDGFLDSADIALVKSKSGTALP